MKQDTFGTIGYVGNVSIQLKHGNTIYYSCSSHNEGTFDLFKGLCCLLAGQSYQAQANNLPSTIRLYNVNGSIRTALIDRAIPISTNIEAKAVAKYSNNYAAILHFNIPGNYITRDSTITHLVLCGRDGTTQLAEFKLATPLNTNDFTSNSQFLVEWTLSFANIGDNGGAVPSANETVQNNAEAQTE